MKGIAQDFVRYVMHVQVVQNERRPRQPAVQNVQTDVERRRRSRPVSTAPRAAAVAEGDCRPVRQPVQPARPRKPKTVVKDDFVEDAAQRPVPVRVGQEVQAVPRRRLNDGVPSRPIDDA